jgi:hypothetical protein
MTPKDPVRPAEPEPDLLRELPTPEEIQERLGQLAREEKILRRLMPLAMAARREVQERRQLELAEQKSGRGAGGGGAA